MSINNIWEKYKNEHTVEYSFQRKLMNQIHEKYVKDMKDAFYKGFKEGIEYVFTEILKNVD